MTGLIIPGGNNYEQRFYQMWHDQLIEVFGKGNHLFIIPFNE
jgi:hypothetical protein